ncbi:MAG: pyridoxal phosphate-dependent aminotransferase [Candidatus Aminicenantes bacterium]|nr:pyridoxal phosphate-dependent aminotransferase [Candidatus Aminicenantes bacterium]
MKSIEKSLIRQVNDRADASCLNLGLGEPGFPPPRAILEHVRGHLAEWKAGYSAVEGLPELRRTVAEVAAGDGGGAIDPARVCITAGSQEALFVLLMTLLEPGDEVLVPDPGFPAYPSIARVACGTAVAYPLGADNGFHLDPTDILARVTPKTKAIVLNTPNNPAGAVYGEGSLAGLAAGLAGSGIPVIADECYRALTFGSAPRSFIRHYPDAVAVGSISKSHALTGWRLGWMIVPDRLVGRFSGVHQLAVTCASVVSQRAAIFALKGGADEECEANRTELKRRRDLALAALREHTGLLAREPEGAFYLFARADRECSRAGGSLALALKLIEEEKVVITPGAAFGPGGEGCLRISFAAEPDVITAGLERLGRFLKRLRG